MCYHKIRPNATQETSFIAVITQTIVPYVSVD